MTSQLAFFLLLLFSLTLAVVGVDGAVEVFPGVFTDVLGFGVWPLDSGVVACTAVPLPLSRGVETPSMLFWRKGAGGFTEIQCQYHANQEKDRNAYNFRHVF
jgi:hypothetical protein